MRIIKALIYLIRTGWKVILLWLVLGQLLLLFFGWEVSIDQVIVGSAFGLYVSLLVLANRIDGSNADLSSKLSNEIVLERWKIDGVMILLGIVVGLLVAWYLELSTMGAAISLALFVTLAAFRRRIDEII